MRIIIVALLTFLFCSGAHAVECSAVFPDPASSYSSSGSIQFQPGTSLVGSDGTIDFTSMIDNSGGISCDSAACYLSGGPSGSMTLPAADWSTGLADVSVGAFDSQRIAAGDYDEVRLSQNATLTTTTSDGTYRIKTLFARLDSLVTLASGTYWIDAITLEQNARIEIAAGAQVIIYTKSLSLGNNVKINDGTSDYSRSTGDAEAVTIVVDGSVSIGQYSKLRAFIYATGAVTYNTDIYHQGAVNAQSVVLNNRSKIYYDSTAIVNLNLGGLCSTAVSVASPIGHWPIDLCALSGNSGEVVDVAGSNSGQSFNGPSIEQNGRLCQAAYIRGAGDGIKINHQTAYETPNGAVSMWLNTDNFTNIINPSASGMAFFSKDSSGTDTGGHLTMWVMADGSIKVQHQNTLTSYQIVSMPLLSEGQWHHVVYTFGTGGMKLYVDGALAGSNTSYTQGLNGNAEPIILGAGATSTRDFDSPPEELTDYYQGRIDDVQLFDEQLTQEQILLLFGESEGTCTTCTSSATLVANWRFDVCALNGTRGEVVDVVNGYNGTALNGPSSIPNGRFCQSVGFDGNNDHVNIPHQSAMAISSGSLSLWFNIADLYNNRGLSIVSRSAIFSKDSRYRDDGGQFTLYVDDFGRLTFHQETPDKTDDIYSDRLVISANWYHVVYSWGPSGMKVYLNGQYLGGSFDTSYSWATNPEPIILGASATQSSNGASYPSELRDFFKGEIDDVRLYNGELSDSEIQALFTASDYTCDNCTGEGPRVVYRFEDTDVAHASPIQDSSGYDQSGTALNGATTLLPDEAISCRALDIPNNSGPYQQAVNTNLDINNIGERGTVSFWYRSDQPWIGGGDRQLFDASTGNTSLLLITSTHLFYMSLTHAGELTFAMEDVNNDRLAVKANPLGYGAGEWVHIALTWDIPGEDIDLFVNGTRVLMYGLVGLTSNRLKNLPSLILGDNSSRYFGYYSVDNSANGQFDDFRLYDYEQSVTQIRNDMQATQGCYGVHHYEITHPSQALTCSSAQVTISACADALCYTLADTPMTVNLSSGNWSPSSSLTFTGTTTLSLSQSEVGTHDITVSAADSQSQAEFASTCNGDCSIDFVSAGFEFFDSTNQYSTTLPDITAQSDLSAIGLRAVKDSGGVCKALLTGTQSVSITYDCIADSSSVSTNKCTVPFAEVAVSGDGTGVSSGNVSLAFDSNGEASLTGYHYDDAGRLSIGASATVSGISITSGSNEFDSIPASISLTADIGAVNVAGSEFDISISALGRDGAELPGYSPGNLQMQLTRQIPSSVAANDAQFYLSSSTAITSSVSPLWTDVTLGSFINGQYNYSNAYLQEIGTYSWQAKDNRYLGSTITSNSVTLGRFIPAYFDVTASLTPQWRNSCSSNFTYIGQPFGFASAFSPTIEVTAYNAKGAVTSNYADSLWKLSPSVADLASALSFSNNTSYKGSLLTLNAGTVPVVSGITTFDGTGEILIENSSLAYSKITTPAAGAGSGSPFNADIDLTLDSAFFTDSDGACYQTAYPGSCEDFTINSITGTQLRYGRVNMNNTFGPETESLRVPLYAEYYNNGSWVDNTQDSCTPITLSQSAGNITVVNTSSGTDENDITSILSPLSSAGFLVQGVSGDTDLVVDPPMDSSGNYLRGAVKVTLEPAGADWSNYLNFDWDNDGDIDVNDKPEAMLNFGLYRGNDRTIHWRENE